LGTVAMTDLKSVSVAGLNVALIPGPFCTGDAQTLLGWTWDQQATSFKLDGWSRRW